MAVDTLLENDTFVCELRHALNDGKASLADVPALLKCVLKDGRWRERTIKTGDVVRFDYFEQFVSTPPLEGLGATVDLIRRIVGNDPEAVSDLDAALQKKEGRPETFDNIQGLESAPTGTSEQAALRRLRKDRPDLHQQVIAGEKSAHAAMVEAGFRRRTLSIPVEATLAARVIARHFDTTQLADLIEALNDILKTRA